MNELNSKTKAEQIERQKGEKGQEKGRKQKTILSNETIENIFLLCKPQQRGCALQTES